MLSVILSLTWDHINMSDSNCHWNLYLCQGSMLLSPVRLLLRSTLSAITNLMPIIHPDSIDVLSVHCATFSVKLYFARKYQEHQNRHHGVSKIPNATGSLDFKDPY